MLKKCPNKKTLREFFDYLDGYLYWRVSTGGELKGARAGCLDRRYGYIRIGFKGSDYFAHRLIWVWHFGANERFIDHKNQNKADNRIENLRPATKAHNEWHVTKRRHNTTGFKGVYRLKIKTPSPFWAYITANGRRRGLGCFKTAREAAIAYNAAAKKYHRKFACLNTI